MPFQEPTYLDIEERLERYRQKRKEYTKAYYYKNREKLLQRQKEFYAAHPEARKKYQEKYRKDKVGKIRKYFSKEQLKEKTKNYNQDYYLRNKEAIGARKREQYLASKASKNTD